MKVQLVFVPARRKQRLSDLVENVYPPLGILYLAGRLRVEYGDLSLKATDGLLIGWDKTVDEIRRFHPDVVFLSFLTPCATSAYQLCDTIKEMFPHVKVVMGGAHATTLPAEPFDNSCVDVVVAGEGEVAATGLVGAWRDSKTDLGSIPGLFWRSKGAVVVNEPARYVERLDDIPFPARDLLDLKAYNGWFVTQQTPDTSILFSRGCPFDCTFCTNVVWRNSRPRVRLRSARNIVDEMEMIRDMGYREVFDNSDEFNCHQEHALEICREIASRKLGMTWKTQLRAHPVSDELVRAMAEAGCWYVHLGIESGNQRTLDGIRKKITLEQVESACKTLKKYNIKVFGLFMLYNAWEENGILKFEDTRDTNNTISFAKRLIDKGYLDYISSTIATPYPGSELFSIAQRHSLISASINTDWEKWLTEESFLLNLPGVSKRASGRTYFKASLLRGYCFLRAGKWKLKDLPLFINKFVRAMLVGLRGS